MSSADSNNGRILLVDDDADLLRLLSIRLRAAGYDVDCARNGEEALDMLRQYRPQLVITDLCMPGMNGMDLLSQLQRRAPDIPVILLTAHGTIPDAVAATQGGAFDFLTKPVDKDALLPLVRRALALHAGNGTREGTAWSRDIITAHPMMEQLLEEARLLAASDSSVLITGESGTGKELLAHAIHKASARHRNAFVPINCGAMPESLLESELFGHEKGAFTGAVREHEGLLRAASGGTVFLDEIGDMPLLLQVKLLRVLQERHVRPVGGTRSFPIDVRVISATHRDLRAALAEGRFREDLYYRLNVVTLHLPSLAERASDIPLLVRSRLQQLAHRSAGRPKVYAPEAMELLVTARWPGNVRQLFNVVEQNVALSPTPVISASVVQKALGEDVMTLPSFAQARDEFTRSYLIQLLQATSGNVSQAARLAERNRTEFYKLLARYQLNPALFKAGGDSDD